MSKDNIQDVVRKSLDKYFRDLGEQEPRNVYDMVVLTVERPILEAVMAHDAVAAHREMRSHLLAARGATARLVRRTG